MEHYVNSKAVERFRQRLIEEEKCSATIDKYINDVRSFLEEQGEGVTITKERIIRYKQNLVAQGYAIATINGVIASLNSFFKKMGWYDCVVKSLKMQRAAFRSQERELSKKEYYRLLQAAKHQGNLRLYYLMQTICSTGIRVSELRFITVEAVSSGRARVSLKGKSRMILLPAALCQELKRYVKERGIASGSIFVTKNGKPLDRSNIFKEMKQLCEEAEVDSQKVFPHNLRHLFACMYYKVEKDIAHLADILGHSSVETTRVYLKTSSAEQERQIERLGLVVR